MKHEIEEMVRTLRNTREGMGMSQRELSAKSGVTQSQISKIERGSVDLTLSSLISITRALGLEAVLIPRQMLPVVDSIVQKAVPRSIEEAVIRRLVLKESQNIWRTIKKLPKEDSSQGRIVKLQHLLHELQNYPPTEANLEVMKATSRSLKRLLKNPGDLLILEYALSQLQKLRNKLVGKPSDISERSNQRPLYSLEDE